MASRNRDRQSEADQPKAGIPPWVWPLLALPVLGLMAVVAVVGGLVWFVTAKVGPGLTSATNKASNNAPDQKPSGRMTFTREEVREIWNWNRTTEKIKDKFGPPDKTTELDVPWKMRSSDPLTPVASGTDRVTVYHYYRLSIDAKGSGKVDSEVRLKFGTLDPPEFIP